MSEPMFVQRRAGELRYWEAGSGETIVALVGDGDHAARAYALLAERRRVLVFALPADSGTPPQAARRIVAALATLGVERFDLMGEGVGAAAALWLALAPEVVIGAVALAAPDGPPDDAFRELQRPVLVLCGTKDGSDAGERYRMLLPGGHFMLVYDADRTIAAERPEALAFVAQEFFERRDLFLVSRESGMSFP